MNGRKVLTEAEVIRHFIYSVMGGSFRAFDARPIRHQGIPTHHALNDARVLMFACEALAADQRQGWLA